MFIKNTYLKEKGIEAFLPDLSLLKHRYLLKFETFIIEMNRNNVIKDYVNSIAPFNNAVCVTENGLDRLAESIIAPFMNHIRLNTSIRFTWWNSEREDYILAHSPRLRIYIKNALRETIDVY